MEARVTRAARVSARFSKALGETPVSSEPGEGALDHPTAQQNDEALLVVAPLDDLSTVTEGIAIGGSVSNSTITNTVNNQDPAVLAAMVKTFAVQMTATTEARAQAEARAAELATKFGFTAAAVGEFFKILGEKNVSEEKIPARLIEIATQFAQTRDDLTALEPDDPHTAELTGSAKQALDSGRLTEADALLDQAKEGELAALRQARDLKQKAQEAEDRHALNAAKFLAARGNIALTKVNYFRQRSSSSVPRPWCHPGIRTREEIIFATKPVRSITLRSGSLV
jgi:hypothetical protein